MELLCVGIGFFASLMVENPSVRTSVFAFINMLKAKAIKFNKGDENE
jgi:hypothetical protein